MQTLLAFIVLADLLSASVSIPGWLYLVIILVMMADD